MSIEKQNMIRAILAFLGAGFAIGAISGLIGGHVSIGEALRQFITATLMFTVGICGGRMEK
jgi:hypothetical protein